MKKIKVLITGIGAPGAPGIIKSLRIVQEREIEIVGCDINLNESVGLGMVDKAYQIPSATDNKFIDSLKEIAHKEKIDVIIPLVTKELFPLSLHKKEFEEIGTKIQISDYPQLQTANNKYELFKFLKKNKLPHPEFYLVKSLDEFVEKARQLGYPEKKICFKPPVSNGLRGFRIIDNSSDKMYRLIHEKPNNVYIGFDEFIQIAKDADFFPDLLLMEYLPGEEYSVDVLVDNGKYIQAIPRSRDKIKMGISFVGTAVKDDEIIDISKQIVEQLKLNGNIGLQLKRDENGRPKVIESNPRVQGTIVLATASGYNMVYNSIKLALNEELPKPQIHWNTRMVRYWDEIFFTPDGKSFKLEVS